MDRRHRGRPGAVPARLRLTELITAVASGEPAATAWERSDVTAIGAAPVIVEAMLALVLADALLEKLGGDAIADTDRAFGALAARLAPWWQPRRDVGTLER